MPILRHALIPVAVVFLALVPGPAAAQAPGSDGSSSEAEQGSTAEPSYGATTAPEGEGGGEPEAPAGGQRGPRFGATAEVEASDDEAREDLASSRVTHRELQERQPRSAPEALRWEPGVSVQQTAHSQASPYVRGMTGQQVVHLFDGIRLNNGIYRQGPNQYFFTVDSRTVHHIDVVRGSASTRFGSDALGGAILAAPVEPLVDPSNEGLTLRPRAFARYRSTDDALGGRAQLEASLGDDTALLVGGGYRDVGRLRSGGVVENVDVVEDPVIRSDVVPWVPRFVEEREHPGLSQRGKWKTQLGTGYREATFDARLVHAVTPELQVVGAVYGYRQMDAPRTDKCPPPEAPLEECLEIDEQFRTLAYASLRGDAGPLRDLQLSVSFARHHELRVTDRPRSFVRLDALDEVDTLGIDFQAATPRFDLADGGGHWRVRYGFDAYRDGVTTSRRSQRFTDVDRERQASRGQYLDGSSYITSGLFVEGEITPRPWLTVRAGGRGALAGVRAPPDPESGSRAIGREMTALVARAGVELRPVEPLAVQLNVDQGFRAPNLDDLTSRQQVGPGFQFENADLSPERSTTYELGVLTELPWMRLDAWAFATMLDDAIQRVVREAEDCPPETDQCRTSRNQFQLVNLEERARIFGAEGGVTFFLPEEIALRSTISWAWGDGPNPGGRITDPALLERGRLPLSRIPPLGGTVEARWRHLATGLWASAGLRWARAQQRLAVADRSDPRIPAGGTPGYQTLDLRAGWRWGSRLLVTLIVENVLDEAYRVHGSSINGPGRGVTLAVEGGL